MAKTWHDRVWDMLNVAQAESPNDLGEFLRGIPGMPIPPDSFVYMRCNEEGNREPECSLTAVSRTADLCIELRLMDKETGGLTALGEKATQATSFEKIVGRQLWKVLAKEFGLAPDSLSTITRSLLRRKTIVLPTADAIWSELGEPGDLMRFKRLLRLLAKCGGATVSQRPVYLPLEGH